MGNSVARADDFDCLDWNKNVPHIAVTGSSGGFVTVWDVKTKKESLTLNNMGRKAVSAVAWDPNKVKIIISLVRILLISHTAHKTRHSYTLRHRSSHRRLGSAEHKRTGACKPPALILSAHRTNLPRYFGATTVVCFHCHGVRKIMICWSPVAKIIVRYAGIHKRAKLTENTLSSRIGHFKLDGTHIIHPC